MSAFTFSPSRDEFIKHAATGKAQAERAQRAIAAGASWREVKPVDIDPELIGGRR